MKITVGDAAAIMGCSEQFIRIGLQRGQLDIGDAVRMSNRWTYNIAPARLAARQGMTVQELEEEIRSRKTLAC